MIKDPILKWGASFQSYEIQEVEGRFWGQIPDIMNITFWGVRESWQGVAYVRIDLEYISEHSGDTQSFQNLCKWKQDKTLMQSVSFNCFDF